MQSIECILKKVNCGFQKLNRKKIFKKIFTRDSLSVTKSYQLKPQKDLLYLFFQTFYKKYIKVLSR